jgi:starvation-inducible DNA-binding protein
MEQTTQIGLDAAKSKRLADKLNVLLADYQIFYINARGFHWNISGDKFFELHAKFEEIYTDALLKIDEIAERILTLGYTPVHTFSEYVRTSSIKEVMNVSEGKTALQHVLAGLQTLIVNERELLALSQEANDEGTSALMSDYIRRQEKLVWMFSAFLK